MWSDNPLRGVITEIAAKLQTLQQRITCIESCTGGGIAKAFTDMPGSSAWFDRGFVAYNDLAKHEMVGVKKSTLAEFGAVSEAVVREMAEGALFHAKADFAIATTGIAGPDGGTAQTPTGTVWFGFASRQQPSLTCVRHFTGDREIIRQQAVVVALELLLEQFLRKSS